MNKNSQKIVLFIILAVVLYSCGTQRKLGEIVSTRMQAQLVLPKEKEVQFRDLTSKADVQRDTFSVVDVDGRKMIIMNAVKDEESGEMVATQQLNAAVVTARFRNIAERHGKIDIEFQVIVPQTMQDSKWQLRFNPDMFIMQDSVRLDPVIITGHEYRKAQLLGYQRYERFLNSIITDSTRFINEEALEIFLQRNIPQLYAFKADSSEVSDEQFASAYGVTEKEAVDHYTDKLRLKWNNNRKNRKDKMFHKYVKAPIVTEGIRLDTVVRMNNGDFIYNYVQTVNTRPKLRKVDIVLSGDIREQDKVLYKVPRTEPLTFYVSSLSAFVDARERYMTRIIERQVEANTVCNIDFAVGKYDIDERLGDNSKEISRIKSNLRGLLDNVTFDLDSITISAYASPEGTSAANDILCSKRAASASRYFDSYVKRLQDSLRREEAVHIHVDDNMKTSTVQKKSRPSGIKFKSRNGGENWGLLDVLVFSDVTLSEQQVNTYNNIKERYADPDQRERAMSKESWYSHIKDAIYPRLRVVQFNFFLHRKGMVKDTVHMTELDTLYMNGVQCIRDRDYEGAVIRLRDYNDFNTAIAYTALDRNVSAMNILKTLEADAKVNYMMAIIYSRQGDEKNAVQCYLRSCSQDKSFVNRGNLDPEISVLIRKYNLNKQEDDEFSDLYSF